MYVYIRRPACVLSGHDERVEEAEDLARARRDRLQRGT